MSKLNNMPILGSAEDRSIQRAADRAIEREQRKLNSRARNKNPDGSTAFGATNDTGKYRPASWGSMPPPGQRIGMSATPRLDQTAKIANQANQTDAAKETFAQTDARKKSESSLRGAFGEKAQNLAGRKALFSEMQNSGGVTPAMEARSKELGVSGPAWRRVAASIPPAPLASPSAAQIPPLVTASASPAFQPVPNVEPVASPANSGASPNIAAKAPLPSSPAPMPAVTPPAATPAPAAPPATPAVPAWKAPQFGAEIAQANVAKMGVAGASEDYFKRSAADEELRKKRRMA